MPSDWKAGKLLGAQYAIVADGRVVAVRETKELLRSLWRHSVEKSPDPRIPPELPEEFIKQVVVVLPPWEKA